MLGAGGIGMAGLARLLASQGLEVSGCDAGVPRTLEWLRSCGIPVQTGHDPAHLENADWVVFSPAVPEDEPERAAALARGLPLLRRGEVLPVLAERWRTVAVSGTHGKTTTSAMITHLLRECGADPSWCIGGELPPHGEPAGVGKSDWLVVEADESDGTLAGYAPELAVITNIEFDHMEHFADEQSMLDCFRIFARQARRVLYNADDPHAAAFCAEHANGVSFGWSSAADYYASDLQACETGTAFHFHGGQQVTEMSLPLTGRHNVINAVAALAAVELCGISMERVREALAGFRLPRRRFEELARGRGIVVVGDYAHHPTEIRAAMDAATQAGAKRVWAIFQPHRYTRTAALGTEFPAAFDGAAGVILTPVYAASELPIAGGTADDLLQHFLQQQHTAVELAADLPDAAARVMSRWVAGDWVLLLGAGDIESLGARFQRVLTEE